MDHKHFAQVREQSNAKPSTFKMGRWANDDEVAIITSLLSLYMIRNYFECGTANGWTAAQAYCAMETASPGVPLNCHTWDIVDRPQVETPYLNLVVHHIESFDTGVGAVLAETRGRKLIFIDGDHTGQAPINDFRAVEKFLRIGDVVVFHDSLGEAPVARAIARVRENHPRWKYVEHKTRRGVGVFEVY